MRVPPPSWPPGFDENLGLLEVVENLSVEEPVAQTGVEALDVAVLPWRTRLDEGCAGADQRDLLPHGPGDELWTVVGPHIGRDAAQDEQSGQDIDDVA